MKKSIIIAVFNAVFNIYCYIVDSANLSFIRCLYLSIKKHMLNLENKNTFDIDCTYGSL